MDKMIRFDVKMEPYPTANKNKVTLMFPRGKKLPEVYWTIVNGGQEKFMENLRKNVRHGIRKTKEAEDFVKELAKELKRQYGKRRPIESEVGLMVWLSKRVRPGDRSNYSKGIEDALELAGVIKDDYQIKSAFYHLDQNGNGMILQLYPLERFIQMTMFDEDREFVCVQRSSPGGACVEQCEFCENLPT